MRQGEDSGLPAKRLVLVVALVVLVAAYRILDLGQYLTLDYIKQSQSSFAQYYADHTIRVIAIYMGIYIVSTALSLPGAVVLTLAGGALFGLLTGTVVISFASSIGATLAFVVSRFLLRDWVQARFEQRLGAINRGMEAEGAFYLFTLRLIPVFPFFVINLVMGLTRMRAWTFYWVSQVGMLAGTVVYVNAGKELARIDSLGGILSPGLIVSFALLGLLPITARKLIGYYRGYRKRTGPADADDAVTEPIPEAGPETVSTIRKEGEDGQ